MESAVLSKAQDTITVALLSQLVPSLCITPPDQVVHDGPVERSEAEASRPVCSPDEDFVLKAN